MEKKALYVVTETIVRFNKKDVTTFVVGVSRDFGIARKILEDSMERLILDGFDEKLFDCPNKWEWTYSYFDSVIKNEIIYTEF